MKILNEWITGIEKVRADRAELLAACKGLLSICDRYTGVGLAEMDAARAAIQKAERGTA